MKERVQAVAQFQVSNLTGEGVGEVLDFLINLSHGKGKSTIGGIARKLMFHSTEKLKIGKQNKREGGGEKEGKKKDKEQGKIKEKEEQKVHPEKEKEKENTEVPQPEKEEETNKEKENATVKDEGEKIEEHKEESQEVKEEDADKIKEKEDNKAQPSEQTDKEEKQTLPPGKEDETKNKEKEHNSKKEKEDKKKEKEDKNQKEKELKKKEREEKKKEKEEQKRVREEKLRAEREAKKNRQEKEEKKGFGHLLSPRGKKPNPPVPAVAAVTPSPSSGGGGDLAEPVIGGANEHAVAGPDKGSQGSEASSVAQPVSSAAAAGGSSPPPQEKKGGMKIPISGLKEFWDKSTTKLEGLGKKSKKPAAEEKGAKEAPAEVKHQDEAKKAEAEEPKTEGGAQTEGTTVVGTATGAATGDTVKPDEAPRDSGGDAGEKEQHPVHDHQPSETHQQQDEGEEGEPKWATYMGEKRAEPANVPPLDPKEESARPSVMLGNKKGADQSAEHSPAEPVGSDGEGHSDADNSDIEVTPELVEGQPSPKPPQGIYIFFVVICFISLS